MVCRAYRLPHSAFLGWSKDDRDKAIWELARSREVCHGCGTREAEWLPSAGGSRHAYRAEEHICPGCEVLEFYREKTAKQKAQVKGAHIRLVRTRVRR
jgi:hypothetical protein